MKKVYLFITLFDDSTCSITTFETLDKAKESLNKFTEGNLKLNNTAVIYKEYDKNFVPHEVYRFWPTGNVIIGNTVREDDFDGSYIYTYRFIIETELK